MFAYYEWFMKNNYTCAAPLCPWALKTALTGTRTE